MFLALIGITMESRVKNKKQKETNIESRLSALESSTEVLESKIDILTELNFQNNELSNNKTPKEDGARPDSNSATFAGVKAPSMRSAQPPELLFEPSA